MDIFQALQHDHEEVKELLDQLVKVSENNESTQLLLDEIKEQLIPHARAEEAVFYNPLREVESAKEKVSHAYGEHMKAETILRTLRGMEKVGIEWTALAKKLRDEVNHHIEEEEGPIFSIARPLLTQEERNQMGAAFLSLKDDVESQSDLKNTMDMIANMMPARFASSVRNLTNIGS